MTGPSHMSIVADNHFHATWTSLCKLVGSISVRHEHCLVNQLVDDETVADCIVFDL